MFRQEFDDWSILFEPDTGNTYALNPVGTYIWQHLDGKHTVGEVLELLGNECEDELPQDAPTQLKTFLSGLKTDGLIACK